MIQNIPKQVINILSAIQQEGGKSFLVGGIVRNHFLGIENQDRDFDFEIYGLTEEKLVEILSRFGKVNYVGKQFGVYKLEGLQEADFALPRLETKTGEKHQDFHVEVNGLLNYEEAAKRRDITINAILLDPFTMETIDPYHGLDDLKRKIIRYVDIKKFQEDPLRVLRVAGFKARLGFDVDSHLINLCKNMVQQGELDYLPAERIFEEYKKILLRSDKPSIAFNFLKEIDALPRELNDLIGCYQRADFHPEGDVWTHTMMVLDEGAKVKNQTENPIGFMFACLLHDVGKPSVTTKEGKAPKHDYIGRDIAYQFMQNLKASKELSIYVKKMVENHMRPMQYTRDQGSNKSYLKLLKNIENVTTIYDLFLLSKCDSLGRGLVNKTNIEKMDNYLKKMVEKNGDRALPPLVLGTDLLELGYQQGVLFKDILYFAYQLQLSGYDKEKIISEIRKKY